MSLDIPIKVSGLEKLREAKRAVDELSQGKPGSGGGAAGVDKKTTQASAAAKVFRREMESAQKATEKIARDFDRLIRMPKPPSFGTLDSMGRTSPKAGYYNRASEIAEEVRNQQRRRLTYAEQYESIHGNRGRTVGGGGTGGGPGNNDSYTNGPLSSNLKKALGWTMAAAGGFSALSFLTQSRSKYQQSVGSQVLLEGRGIKGGADAGINLGIGPLEYQQFLELMSNQGVGAGRIHSSSRLAAAFSKANGVDTATTSGLYGSLYHATGSASTGSSVLAMAVKSGIEKTRLSEYMQLVSRNTGISAQAMHGAGATPGQAGAAAALAGIALNSGNHYLKSTEFFNVAQNGLRGAGTIPGDISIAKALGVFDGDISWEKIFKIEEMKEGGFLKYPKAFDSIMGDLTSRSREGKAAELMKKYPFYELSTKAALEWVDVHEGDIFTKAKNNGLQKMTEEQEKQFAATLTRRYGNLNMEGSKRQIQTAKDEATHISMGATLDEMFRPFEKTIFDMADKFLSSETAQTMAKSVGEFGGWVSKLTNNPSSAVDDIKSGKFRKNMENIPLTGPWMLNKAKDLFNWNFGNNKGWGDIGNAFENFFIRDAGAADLPVNMLGNRLNGKASKNPYMNDFERAAKATGVDFNLLTAIGLTESGFKANAVSNKGAVGVMQLMPKTAQMLRVDPMNPSENIMGASRFFADLNKKYGGNTDKALAAYNWGPGNLDKWMQRHDFNIDELPRETSAFIRKVNKTKSNYDIETSVNNRDVFNPEVIKILVAIAESVKATADNTSFSAPVAAAGMPR